MMTVTFLFLFKVRIQTQTPLPVTWRKGCAGWVVLAKTHCLRTDLLLWQKVHSSNTPSSIKGFCLAQLNAHQVLLSSRVPLQHRFSLACLGVKASSILLILLNRQHNWYCLCVMRATSHLFPALSSGHTHQLHLHDTSAWSFSEKWATTSSATSTIKPCF